MMDDSDYVPTETETETETETPYTMTGSQSSHQTSFYDADSDDSDEETETASVDVISAFEIDDNDFCSIVEETYEEFDDYFNNNILQMSSPKFHDNMIEHITEIYFDYWKDINICDETDYGDIYDLMEQIYDMYVAFSEIPRRSISTDEVLPLMVSAEKLQELHNKIVELQNTPQPAQRTPEWYEFRNSLITASNLWKVFGTEAQVNSIIYEKCRPAVQPMTFSNNTQGSMHWGVKYEPVSAMIYEAMYKTTLGEFGCIRHPKYPFIGASPDGINIDRSSDRYGRMVEIKNIFNREMTGIPKLEYWVQTQIQMETCDLDECDFVETRFKEYVDESAFYADEEHHIYRGIILSFHSAGGATAAEKDCNDAPVTIYRYMPLSIIIDKESVEEWVQTECVASRTKGLCLFSMAYWYLDCISCVLIQRNREWFEAAVPIIKKTWETIEKERESGYEHRASVKKNISGKNKVIVVSPDSHNSYLISNMPTANSICLVKLD